jgi:hypothetical protein
VLAIRKLGRRIATAKDRTHIVVTARTNAWRPKTDLALCVTHLPFTPATTTAKEDASSDTDDAIEDAVETSDRPAERSQPVFKIVTLDDLSRSQIEAFANARGINHTKAFIEAIERADAWSFTSRPQDLMELTEFWLDQGRIGSRLEIVRNSISRRLHERDQERVDIYPLAPQKALQGARLIAAATTLAQDSTIRRSEDIDRAGKGVYSPGLRDNAQDSRNGLFDLLNKIPGKKAFLALQEISQSHPEVESRPWFAHLAKVKAEQDSDIAPWMPAQVRDFHDKLERTPANHRELAELAVMRFLDLKDDLENGDSSIAAILKAGATLETDMRKYIGRELREKASARYSVPQEEEFADAKKPDIRFHGMGFDAPVPAELKLADKWTGPELFERLENQLCGDYLRDNRSARGVFVLVRTGEKAGWDVPGGANRVDFEGLIAALQNRWEEIAQEFPGVDEITVIGIDLLKRAA